MTPFDIVRKTLVTVNVCTRVLAAQAIDMAGDIAQGVTGDLVKVVLGDLAPDVVADPTDLEDLDAGTLAGNAGLELDDAEQSEWGCRTALAMLTLSVTEEKDPSLVNYTEDDLHSVIGALHGLAIVLIQRAALAGDEEPTDVLIDVANTYARNASGVEDDE